jgi:hypothetical protein
MAIWDRCYNFSNIFAQKFSKKLAFLTQNKASFWKKLILTLVFKKNANFFAENWEESQKIVIVTSTPLNYLFPSLAGGQAVPVLPDERPLPSRVRLRVRAQRQVPGTAGCHPRRCGHAQP